MYSYKSYYSLKFCCCCSRKKTLEDKLFEKARKKLYAEIDLLQIIKQLRIVTFASEILLKPHQMRMVKYFDEYKIKIRMDEDEDKKDDKVTETLDFFNF